MTHSEDPDQASDPNRSEPGASESPGAELAVPERAAVAVHPAQAETEAENVRVVESVRVVPPPELEAAEEREPAGPTVIRVALPTWLWPPRIGGITAIALVLIAASLILKWNVLGRAYFVEDDFQFVMRATEGGFDWDYLLRSHKTHLMPGAFALVWVLAHIEPYGWGLTAAITLVLQAAASLAVYRMLRELFGARPGVLVALAVYLFSPLTVPAFSWWSAALNAVPLQLAIALAVTAHVRYLRTGRHKSAIMAVLWIIFGLAFGVKGVFIVPLLYALTSAFFTEGSWVRGMAEALRRHFRVWLLYAAVLGVYAPIYLNRREAPPASPVPEITTNLVKNLLGQTFPTGAVGGPLRWGAVTPTGGLAWPAEIMVIGAWAAIGALVVLSLAYRRNALRAWAILLGYLLIADVLTLVIARGGTNALLGFETRYVADAGLIFALCLALAFLPLRGEPLQGERGAYLRPLPGNSIVPLVTGLLAAAYVASGIASINGFAETLSGDRNRAYIENAAKALAKAGPDVEIFSRPVPEHVMLAWNGPDRMTHRVLAPLASTERAQRMRKPGPSERPMVFDEQGRLQPMTLAFGQIAPAPQGAKCYPPVGDTIMTPMASPGAGPGGVPLAAAISYTVDRPVTVVAHVGDEATTLQLTQGTTRLINFPVTAEASQMRLVVRDPSARLCVAAVAIGYPVPVPPTPPPPAAVPPVVPPPAIVPPAAPTVRPTP